jgi:hypothetical protein
LTSFAATAHADGESVGLVAALEARGLAVDLDRKEILEFQGTTGSIGWLSVLRICALGVAELRQGYASSGRDLMNYRRIARLLGLASACALIVVPPAGAASGVAPGAPGATALWTPGDKDGFGTSTTSASTVWHTLGGGELTEVYYPNLGTPAVRDLQLVVSDGKSWVDREREDTATRSASPTRAASPSARSTPT